MSTGTPIPNPDDLVPVDLTNTTVLAQLYQKDRDTWHKIWFYIYLIINTLLLLLIYLIVKFSKDERLQRYMPPLKSRL